MTRPERPDAALAEAEGVGGARARSTKPVNAPSPTHTALELARGLISSDVAIDEAEQLPDDAEASQIAASVLVAHLDYVTAQYDVFERVLLDLEARVAPGGDQPDELSRTIVRAYQTQGARFRRCLVDLKRCAELGSKGAP